MTKIEAIKYTMAHRRALNNLAKKYGYSFPLHDLDKIILYPIFGKKITGKLHRLWSRHHERNGDIINKIEAYFDWESSRFTKKDKQETAWQYWRRACPEIDMLWVFEMFDDIPKEFKSA